MGQGTGDVGSEESGPALVGSGRVRGSGKASGIEGTALRDAGGVKTLSAVRLLLSLG